MTILRRSGLSLTLGQRYLSSIRGFQGIPSLTLLDIVKFINPYNEKHLKSTFESFFRQHGNIIKTRLPGTKYDIVYICDPEDGQELLKNDGQFPIITGFDFFVTYRNKVQNKTLFQLIKDQDIVNARSVATSTVSARAWWGPMVRPGTR